MNTENTELPLTGLPARIVASNLIDDTDARELIAEAKEEGISFFSKVVSSEGIDTKTISRLASEEFGIPLVDIESVELESTTMQLVPEKVISKLHIIPLHKRGTKLFVGIADPTDTAKLDEIKFNTGLGIEPVLVDPTQLEKAVEIAIEDGDTTFADLSDDQGLDDIDISAEEDAPSGGEEADSAAIDTPIVRFVNKLLLDALNKGASDIHIEIYETKTRIRLRIDGVMHEVASPPVSLHGRIAARIKILSQLDIAERRIPQDGRMKMRLSKNRSIDFRVSTLPTLFGEKVVIRVLDASATQLGIEALGFEPDQEKLYVDAIMRPYGMVLVTGPTGSGKTVSLYTALGMLNTVERNISTAEDPVEINVPGINQVNVNVKANLTFASALKSFLRQDPDIIMIGEIRDLETAEISIKASQTGHLVLSTLHTNDAPNTLTRMINMGVQPFNVASSVHLILAQRLARRLCSECKAPVDIPEQALIAAGFDKDEVGEIEILGPVGCDQCTGGYKGRQGLFQVMPISEAMQELIMAGCTSVDLEAQSEKEGIYGLRAAGLKKVKAGVTSLAEVLRVTNQ